MIKFNGAPLPPEMSLQDFFNKAKQGNLDRGLGVLASPLANDPNYLDARLDLFENMLNYDVSTAPAQSINAIDAINYATYGNQLGNEAALADVGSQIYDFPITSDSYNAKTEYGLPLWLAIQKGLVK